MAEPNKTDAEPEVQPTTPTTAAKTEGKTYSEAEVEQLVKDRLTRAQAKADKAIKDATEKAAAEAAAKQGDWQKQAEIASKKLAEIEAQLKQRDLTERRRAIGLKVGLPEALALRLQGETDKEIEDDAKAVLDTLPKPPKPAPGPVNPGTGGSTKPTLQQQLDRAHGQQSNPWDIAIMRDKGGGVLMPVEEGKT